MDSYTEVRPPPEPQCHETTASYFARYQVAKADFDLADVPEIELLRAACDYVLTYADGMTARIQCIVDREANPDRRFGMSAGELLAIGKQCQKSGFAKSQTLVIEIIEIGPGIFTEENRSRLEAYRRIFRRPVLSAVIIDTISKKLWTNAKWRGRTRLRQLEFLVVAPRETNLHPPSRQVLFTTRIFPHLTYGLMALLAAIFACEIIFAPDPATKSLAPTVRSLVALGGSSYILFQAGEWYRMLTAPFLHADLVHLLLNGYVLFVIGRLLERLAGHSWFAVTYAVSGLAGSALSLKVNDANIVGVGASGAIMGLLGAAVVIGFMPRFQRVRAELLAISLQFLIPSLLAFGRPTTTGTKIDYAAHIGGALGGAAVGLLMVVLWRQTDPMPRLRVAAAALGTAGILAAAVAGVMVADRYPAYALINKLIPDGEIPRTGSAMAAQGPSLLQRYPKDPRAHFYQGVALLDRNDLKGAETQFQAAIADEKIVNLLLGPGWMPLLHAYHAIAVAEQGRIDEARKEAQPTCNLLRADIRNYLKTLKLCD